MVGMKEFCALLLAGGMGAGSVVAVQHAKPAISKQKHKAQKPKVQKASNRPVQTAQLQDCPVAVAALGDGVMPLAQPESVLSGGLAGLGSPGIGGGGGGFGGGGGGISGPEVLPAPEPVIPGVPQPDTWVMLVAGFGFVGMAIRRRPAPRAQGAQGR